MNLLYAIIFLLQNEICLLMTLIDIMKYVDKDVHNDT